MEAPLVLAAKSAISWGGNPSEAFVLLDKDAYRSLAIPFTDPSTPTILETLLDLRLPYDPATFNSDPRWQAWLFLTSPTARQNWPLISSGSGWCCLRLGAQATRRPSPSWTRAGR
jgi:hypothetical protein